MVLKKNTLAGKNNYELILIVCLLYFSLIINLNAKDSLEVNFTDIW